MPWVLHSTAGSYSLSSVSLLPGHQQAAHRPNKIIARSERHSTEAAPPPTHRPLLPSESISPGRRALRNQRKLHYCLPQIQLSLPQRPSRPLLLHYHTSRRSETLLLLLCVRLWTGEGASHLNFLDLLIWTGPLRGSPTGILYYKRIIFDVTVDEIHPQVHKTC